MARETGPTHELKCWPICFDAIFQGVKTFEVRCNDRPRRFCAGDRLCLREWDTDVGYTGRECWRDVTYVIDLGYFDPALAGYVGMSLSAVISNG